MRVDEVQDALATHYEQGSFKFGFYDGNDIPSCNFILSICCGLMVIEKRDVFEGSQRVSMEYFRLIRECPRLLSSNPLTQYSADYTTRDFIRRLETYASPFSACQEVIVMTCMTHLLSAQDDSKHGRPKHCKHIKSFFTYSDSNWGIHAQEQASDQLDDAIIRFTHTRHQLCFPVEWYIENRDLIGRLNWSLRQDGDPAFLSPFSI